MTVIMACACAGLILMSLQTSGLILKLSNILIAMADGRLWLLMILVMIGSLIMGMGLPASACYIILAILAAPSLVALGVPTIGAHLFVLYFGAMSAITRQLQWLRLQRLRLQRRRGRQNWHDSI